MRPAAEQILPATLETGEMNDSNRHFVTTGIPTVELDLNSELVKIKGGDQQAMARFYDATASRAFAIARAILRQSEDAEEAVFDAYAQIWESADRYASQRATPIGWLTMIVRSRALDRLRRRQAIRESNDARGSYQALKDSAPSPDALLDLMDDRTAVYQALAGLSDIQRHVISLAYFRDYTHAEIARCLEMPIGTIKSHIHRAVNSLRSSLGSSRGDDHE